MASRMSDTIQATLKWFVPFLVVFAVVYAIGASEKEEVVFTEQEQDGEMIVADLYERGYLSNSFSYAIALAAVRLGLDIEAGAYALKKDMGPFAFLAAVTVPE
jgi:cell division protein YceG involved in septum cleavage